MIDCGQTKDKKFMGTVNYQSNDLYRIPLKGTVICKPSKYDTSFISIFFTYLSSGCLTILM